MAATELSKAGTAVASSVIKLQSLEGEAAEAAGGQRKTDGCDEAGLAGDGEISRFLPVGRRD